MTFALCCDNPESGSSITRQLAKLCHVPTETFYNIFDFIAKVSDCPDTVMFIAQTGALSTETAMAARERNPKGKLVWFSDLDFALLSFRLKATYFGLLPVEDDKLKTALSYCEIPLIDEASRPVHTSSLPPNQKV